MKKFLWVVIGAVSLTMISTPVFAVNPVTFDVKISIAVSADITVVQGGPIDFGIKDINSSAVAANPIIIKNGGSGSSQTYWLKLTNPDTWTAVTSAPGFDQYRLSAAFDNAGTGIAWSGVHALTAESIASSLTQFAGNQTGKSVGYDEERKLWLKIETPTGTSSPGNKTIQVSISAVVD